MKSRVLSAAQASASFGAGEVPLRTNWPATCRPRRVFGKASTALPILAEKSSKRSSSSSPRRPFPNSLGEIPSRCRFTLVEDTQLLEPDLRPLVAVLSPRFQGLPDLCHGIPLPVARPSVNEPPGVIEQLQTPSQFTSDRPKRPLPSPAIAFGTTSWALASTLRRVPAIAASGDKLALHKKAVKHFV